MQIFDLIWFEWKTIDLFTALSSGPLFVPASPGASRAAACPAAGATAFFKNVGKNLYGDATWEQVVVFPELEPGPSC